MVAKLKKFKNTGIITAIALSAISVVTVYIIFSDMTKFVATENVSVSEQLETIDSSTTIIHSEQDDGENWMLVLINHEDPLPDDYSPGLKSLDNGLKFDERVIHHLNAMLSTAKEQGLFPVVASAYRTIEYQRTLFNNHISKLTASGLDRDQAVMETRRSIRDPGTSEHNLGLAADIVSGEYQLLDEKQSETPEAKWLFDHCAEYGFILRYPKGKEGITGIKFEPWHYRYVGIEAARVIMENDLCLEEYLYRSE